jgi:hypothetical protein
VLADAAASGEQVVVVQVGAVEAACTEPGAIPYEVDATVPTATPTPECIRAATTPQYDPTTGLYEVPFFDATPVLVQDVGNHNFGAVPVHASQASGAFRAALVRAVDDERYDPKVEQPLPTPLCQATFPAATSPTTACGILSVTPLPATPTVPSEEPTLPTLPPVLPEESATPTPTPTESPTPTPTSTCTGLLCGVGL